MKLYEILTIAILLIGLMFPIFYSGEINEKLDKCSAEEKTSNPGNKLLECILK